MAGLRRDIAAIAAFYAPDLERARAARAIADAPRPSMLDRLRRRSRRGLDGAPA